MKTMKWLLRREYWEHKGSMFWAPVTVAVLLFVTVVGSLGYALATHGIKAKVNGVTIAGVPAEARSELASVLASSYLMTATPLFMMLGVVAFWYCVGALYDERPDRSILFWKSLPASDAQTVLSKALTAGVVMPVITLLVAIVLSAAVLVCSLLGLAANEVNLFGMTFARPQLYLAPFALLSLLPVYVVWALPTIGWLLLVSSWARSKAFLWAVGVPLVSLVLAKWISMVMNNFADVGNGIVDAAGNVAASVLGGLVPGSWLIFHHVNPSSLVAESGHGLDLGAIMATSWASLIAVDAWVGAAAGVAMLALAVRLRRYRDEG